MNRKTLCKQFNILIVLALLLAGCSRAGVSDSQTTSVPGGTDLPQPTETLEKTIILPTAVHPTQTAPAPEPSATPIPLSEFPDIVMNYGDHITCFFEQRNEILVFSFPYREAKLILADPEMDYYLPTWSPDGEWIAYVESRPNIIREGTDDKPGDASIWIMRPDGSERHRVSEYVTDAYFHWVGGDFCDHVSFISAPLAWSKDGRYLAFSHRDYTFRPLSIVYIVDVISGETKLIEAQAEYTSLSWMPDKNNLIMKGDQKEVIIFKVDGLDNIERTSIPKPEEILSDEEFYYLKYGRVFLRKGHHFVYGKFYLYQDGMHKGETIWELNLDTGQWTKLFKMEDGVRASWSFDEDWAINYCANGQIYIYDITTWKLLKTIDTQDFEMSIHGIERMDKKFGDLIRFRGETKDGEKDGVWIMPFTLETEVYEPELLVDFGAFSLEETLEIFITSFSLQP